MRILYTGPFQSNDSIGYCSSIILQSICELANHQTYAHPIYSGHDDVNASNIPYLRMPSLDIMPDIIVSHCLLDTCSINQYSKNYLIPISQQDLSINKKYVSKLKQLDGIIVFNDFDFKKYLDLGISDKHIFKIPYPKIAAIDGNKLDLGIYNSYVKYYFIGNYQGDKSSIKTLISTFIDACNYNDNICLIICCETDRSGKQELISFYEKCKSDLYAHKEDKILLMVDDVSHARIRALHSTSDIFLSINSQYELISNCSMAAQLNNKIVTYSDLQLDELNTLNQTQYTIIKKSLKKIILKIPEKTYTYPLTQLSDILC